MKRQIIVVIMILTLILGNGMTNVYADANQLTKISEQNYVWNILAFDPVGKTAFIESDDECAIWYIGSNTIKKLDGLNYENTKIRYSSDGSKIVFGGSYNYFEIALYIVDIKSGSVTSLDFTNMEDGYFEYIYDNIRDYYIDGNIITIFTDNRVYEYNLKNKQLKIVSDLVVYGDVVLSSDGNTFANYGFNDKDIVIIRDTSDLEQVKSLNVSNIETNGRMYVSYSPQGKYFVVSFSNGGTNVYDTTNYSLVVSFDLGGRVTFCNKDSMLVIDSSCLLESDNFSMIYTYNSEIYNDGYSFVTSDGKYLIHNGDVYDASPMTRRLEKILIKPSDINIDLSKSNNLQLSVTGIYSDGSEKIINNSEVSYIFGDFLKGKVDNNGVLHVNDYCVTDVTAEYAGLSSVVNVHATYSPINVRIDENNISWDSISAAKGYNIYRSEIKGKYNEDPLNDFPIKSTQFIDETQDNAKVYYYVVTALYESLLDSIESQYGKEIGTEKKNYDIKLQIDTPFIYVNGVSTQIDESGTTPLIYDGRTLLPIRTIIESLGGKINWNNEERKVDIMLGSNNITLKIDDNIAYVNGELTTIDVSPKIINGRTMIPIRFIGEKLGCEIEWNQETKVVILKYAE